MYSEISANKRRTWLIMFFFVLLVSGVGVLISLYFTGELYFTIVVLVGSILYATFSYFNAGKMAVAVNGAKQIEEAQHPRLYRIVENLTITTGMPMPKVYIMDDPALNAFATGRDPEHAIVAATTGLLDNLTDTELEGVMAHELGHVKNYDIRVSMIAFALVTVVALLADVMSRSLFWGGGRRDSRNGGGALVLIVGIVVAIIAPIAANLLKLAVSRQREYLADATGAATTRYPEGLASALEKISTQGSQTQKQNSATAHLFFANPLNGKNLAKLFSTHPPAEERIARLRDMTDGGMNNGA